MTPEEQLTDYYVTLQTQVELLAEKLRTMEALVSQIIEKSTEWISPKEAMEILGIKHTQLYRIRESSAENPEKGLEARRRASGRWEYSKRSVLRLASYKGGRYKRCTDQPSAMGRAGRAKGPYPPQAPTIGLQ